MDTSIKNKKVKRVELKPDDWEHWNATSSTLSEDAIFDGSRAQKHQQILFRLPCLDEHETTVNISRKCRKVIKSKPHSGITLFHFRPSKQARPYCSRFQITNESNIELNLWLDILLPFFLGQKQKKNLRKIHSTKKKDNFRSRLRQENDNRPSTNLKSDDQS